MCERPKEAAQAAADMQRECRPRSPRRPWPLRWGLSKGRSMCGAPPSFSAHCSQTLEMQKRLPARTALCVKLLLPKERVEG